jgi:hypothetical protein
MRTGAASFLIFTDGMQHAATTYILGHALCLVGMFRNNMLTFCDKNGNERIF